MPSKISPSSTTKKPVTAADLIAQASQRRKASILPCQDALDQLRALMEHNDAHPQEWVSVDQAQQMLQSWGWTGERSKFDRMLKEAFGRGWGPR